MFLLEDLENVSVQVAAEDLPHRFLKYLVKRLNSAGIKVDEYNTFEKDPRSRGQFKVPNLLKGIEVRTHMEHTVVSKDENVKGNVYIKIKLNGMKLDIIYEVYNRQIKVSLNAVNMTAKEIVDAVIENYKPSLNKINTSNESNFNYKNINSIIETWNDQESKMLILSLNNNTGFKTSRNYDVFLKPKIFKDIYKYRYTSQKKTYQIILNLLDYQGTKRKIKKDDRVSTSKGDYHLFNTWLLKMIASRKEIVKEISHAYDFFNSNGLKIIDIKDSYRGLTDGFIITLKGKKDKQGIEKQSSSQKLKSKSKILLNIDSVIQSYEDELSSEKKRINKQASEYGRYLLKIFFHEPEKFI